MVGIHECERVKQRSRRIAGMPTPRLYLEPKKQLHEQRATASAIFCERLERWWGCTHNIECCRLSGAIWDGCDRLTARQCMTAQPVWGFDGRLLVHCCGCAQAEAQGRVHLPQYTRIGAGGVKQGRRVYVSMPTQMWRMRRVRPHVTWLTASASRRGPLRTPGVAFSPTVLRLCFPCQHLL